MNPRLIFQNKFKRVYKTSMGEVKEIPLDEPHRLAVKEGLHIQPVGKDERQFFMRYPHLKRKYKRGEIRDIHKERTKKKEMDTEADELARELYKQELMGMGKKYL